MTTIQITRHYSGFQNVADWFEVGDHERDGDASCATYRLPEGYSVGKITGLIYDPDGWECEIFVDTEGSPMLMSRGGSRPDTNLTEA